MNPLAPQARLLFYLQAFSRLLFFWLPICLGATLALMAFVAPLWGAVAGLSFAFLLFLGTLWLPSLAFDRWGWQLRVDELLIQRGVIVRQIVAIPTTRIQHVDTRQGPLEQWLGLARLQIYTASGMGADGVIPGLALEQAEALRDQLVRLGGDDGV